MAGVRYELTPLLFCGATIAVLVARLGGDSAGAFDARSGDVGVLSTGRTSRRRATWAAMHAIARAWWTDDGRGETRREGT